MLSFGGTVADGAAICADLQPRVPKHTGRYVGSINRSKVNIALGVESQGFCVIPLRRFS